MALSARTIAEMEAGAARVRTMAPLARLQNWAREKRINVSVTWGSSATMEAEETIVRVGPLTFRELTSKYPSEELFAQVAVALAGNADKQ